MAPLVIDPVTRVNGHLRIEADLASGRVGDARSSGTAFRGIEDILKGRDPRDAWMLAERICGTCTTVHALASVRAVERALDVRIPTNARLIRNLLASTVLVRDHVLGFYQRQAPDWVDARAALQADPDATARLAQSTSAWSPSNPSYFTEIRDRLAATIGSGSGSPLGAGWWDHPAYRLSPEESLLLMAHLVEALEWQRRLMQVHALLGGKDPHPQTYVVGGMALASPWGGPEAPRHRRHPYVPQHASPDPLGPVGLGVLDEAVSEARRFVEQVFVPDVQLIARAYPDWSAIGAGPGRYLSYGEFPLDDREQPRLLLPRGRLRDGNLAQVESVDEAALAEGVDHAWYTYDSIAELRHPADGQTNPAFDQPLPITSLEGADHYTWIKAARYDGVPMETGPLARVLVAVADGQQEVQAALGGLLSGLGLGPEALGSVMGRLIARAVEATVMVEAAARWVTELRDELATRDVAVADITSWDPSTWPAEASGWSLGEGPRGAVGHWVRIRDGVVDHYQVIDASTWNASPRDATGRRGPIEEALVGVEVADPARPLEILRVVHSFSPCIACAVHAVGHRTASPLEIRVRDVEASR
jgi:Ni,Fe-hydrogenase I large subunit